MNISMPSTLQGYQIQRIVGRGGLGIIYEAFILGQNGNSTNKRIALKALSEDDAIKEYEAYKFVGEHPNILKCYSYFTDKSPITVKYKSARDLQLESEEHKQNSS